MLGPRHCRLYLLFTPELCRADPWQTLVDAIAGGVDLVQWRAPTAPREQAQRALEICSTHGVPLIVNDEVELAVELGAAGAHVGQNDMPAREAREMLSPQQWLGVSTHSRDELQQALDDGADHVGFGPMFPTSTKGYTSGTDPARLEEIVAAASVPVFAIGGITPDNLPQLKPFGGDRIAVSGAILQADSPQAAAVALRLQLPSP